MQQYFSHAIPVDFDGMGLLQVENHILQKKKLQDIQFLTKNDTRIYSCLVPFKTALWQSKRLLIDILQNKANNYEMVLVFYAGLTGLKTVDLEGVLSAMIMNV